MNKGKIQLGAISASAALTIVYVYAAIVDPYHLLSYYGFLLATSIYDVLNIVLLLIGNIAGVMYLIANKFGERGTYLSVVLLTYGVVMVLLHVDLAYTFFTSPNNWGSLGNL